MCLVYLMYLMFLMTLFGESDGRVSVFSHLLFSDFSGFFI